MSRRVDICRKNGREKGMEAQRPGRRHIITEVGKDDMSVFVMNQENYKKTQLLLFSFPLTNFLEKS